MMKIPERFARFIESKERFFELLEYCAEESHPYEEEESHEEAEEEGGLIDWDSFDEMTGVLNDVLDGKIVLRREILVGNVDALVKRIREGKNGLGTSWSYMTGHVCNSSRERRYSVEFFAKVLTPETIDYESTYCKDQIDVDCMNPDLEITLKEGGKVLLEKIDVNDSETGKFWTIEMNVPVTITEF